MGEIEAAFLSTPVGKALTFVAMLIVGFWLRQWTYRRNKDFFNPDLWSKTRRADLRREEEERRRLRKRMRKRYDYLNEKGSMSNNESNKSNKNNKINI